jgi:adenylate cyclase
MGRPLQALAHTSQGLAMYSSNCDAAHRYMYGGHDPGVCGHIHVALASWLAGFPERALRERDKALLLARQIDHPLTTTMMLFYTGTVLYLCGDRDGAGEEFERDYMLAQEYGFSRWIDLSGIPRHLRGGAGPDAIAQMRHWLGSTRAASWHLAVSACALAQLLAEAGRPEEAALLLRSFGERSLAHCLGPEILRLEAALLLRAESPDRVAAEAGLRTAIELARGQNSRSLELRAATDLARLLVAGGRRNEAISGLTGIYGGFKEGFDTADLRSARALLEELGAR